MQAFEVEHNEADVAVALDAGAEFEGEQFVEDFLGRKPGGGFDVLRRRRSRDSGCRRLSFGGGEGGFQRRLFANPLAFGGGKLRLEAGGLLLRGEPVSGGKSRAGGQQNGDESFHELVSPLKTSRRLC
ncbi:MAG: hypothetical protein NTZ16_13210 [Verrucomicrobia bacterium]|nr:hypothetical protein [Verrucomicrobiota bacterium]